MKGDNLTPKQKKFCDNYIMSGNATDAAIKAGYSHRSAGSIGEENLKKPDITGYIKAMSISKEISTVATMQEIKEFWTTLIRDDKTTEKKDRLKASEMMAKTNGAFLDRVDITGKIKTDVKITIDGLKIGD